jgi:hypothetical protein
LVAVTLVRVERPVTRIEAVVAPDEILTVPIDALVFVKLAISADVTTSKVPVVIPVVAVRVARV